VRRGKSYQEDHTVDIVVGTVGMLDITLGGMVDIVDGTTVGGTVRIMVGGTTVDGGILGLQQSPFYHFITRQL
jgi:hypothetical protein